MTKSEYLCPPSVDEAIKFLKKRIDEISAQITHGSQKKDQIEISKLKGDISNLRIFKKQFKKS
jgi:prefoldin subunit 5